MNEQFAHIPKNKKVYLASDFHLGAPTQKESLKRERKIVKWLSEIENSAAGIVLVGDLFDFWFEYKRVVPKGCVRLLGKLADLSDKGIPIIVFAGNHDLWMRDYLKEEITAQLLHKPETFQIAGHKILIGHGDGLGPGDRKFKFFKKIFVSKLNQYLFRWLHPDLGIKLALSWSEHSRKKDNNNPQPFLSEQEPLFIYCNEVEKKEHHDFYIFGHRHLQYEMSISNRSKYVNLGDWMDRYTYAEIDSSGVKIKRFEN